MRILLRCDGGPGIGVGHVVRCMALAEEALARSHSVALLGRVEGGLLERLVAETGVTVLGEAQAGPVDILHIDSYAAGGPDVDARVTSAMHDGPHGLRESGLLIDPTPGSWPAPTRPGCLSVAGGRWTPLRRALTAERAGSPTTPARRVLVVMGGTDAAGCAPRVVEALAVLAEDLPLTVTAVSTPATEAELRARAERWPAPGALEVVPPLADLPAAVRASDVVVTAAGTSLWELCVLGVPMAAVQVVDNQAGGYAVVTAPSDAGPAAAGLGTPDDLGDVAATAARLRPALVDAHLRTALVAAAHGVVDGHGARRVVDAWEAVAGGAGPGAAARERADGIRARPATLADTETLWRWRNDPDTRAHSRSSAELPLETHRAWLGGALHRDDRILLVAEDDAGPVGTVRWDLEVAREPQEWEVSITVAPERRGQGRAGPLLAAGELALLAARRDARTVLLAAVHQDNAASRALFWRSGYLPDEPADADGFARLVKQVG